MLLVFLVFLFLCRRCRRHRRGIGGNGGSEFNAEFFPVPFFRRPIAGRARESRPLNRFTSEYARKWTTTKRRRRPAAAALVYRDDPGPPTFTLLFLSRAPRRDGRTCWSWNNSRNLFLFRRKEKKERKKVVALLLFFIIFFGAQRGKEEEEVKEKTLEFAGPEGLSSVLADGKILSETTRDSRES